MEKKLDEDKRQQIVDAIESQTGTKLPRDVKKELVRSMGEEDLVRSGLEETMITAYQEISETMRRKRGCEDLRTAAYVVAIEKIAESYLKLGIFP